MKKNLHDYRKEMEELEFRSERISKNASSVVHQPDGEEKEPGIKAPSSAKWSKLVPGLMAIAMAILTLLFLIISEALKRH